jgi:hypothetical protein
MQSRLAFAGIFQALGLILAAIGAYKVAKKPGVALVGGYALYKVGEVLTESDAPMTLGPQVQVTKLQPSDLAARV